VPAARQEMIEALPQQISACRLCEARFAATATAHKPRPVPWFSPQARVLVAGQAPGMRVHQAGRPFADASGQRLRAWMGLGEAQFYDKTRIAIVPMAFCFPGYTPRGADLPPPPLCAATWRTQVMAALPNLRVVLCVGAHAQRWHMGGRVPVAQRVTDWQQYAPGIFPLPHPSWRNTAWLKRNPWFAAQLLPALRAQLKEVLDD